MSYGGGKIEFVDTPYLILTRSRSGSNLFKDYLNSHPKVKSHGEVFGSIKNNKIENIIEEVYSAENNPHASGFKFFYYHPNGEPHGSDTARNIWAHLKAIPGLKVFNLIRNPMRCIISANIMKQVRDSNLDINHVKMEAGENRPNVNERRVTLEPKATLRMLKLIESLKEELIINYSEIREILAQNGMLDLLTVDE